MVVVNQGTANNVVEGLSSARSSLQSRRRRTVPQHRSEGRRAVQVQRKVGPINRELVAVGGAGERLAGDHFEPLVPVRRNASPYLVTRCLWRTCIPTDLPPRKPLGGSPVSRVRIPPSPPASRMRCSPSWVGGARTALGAGEGCPSRCAQVVWQCTLVAVRSCCCVGRPAWVESTQQTRQASQRCSLGGSFLPGGVHGVHQACADA